MLRRILLNPDPSGGGATSNLQTALAANAKLTADLALARSEADNLRTLNGQLTTAKTDLTSQLTIAQGQASTAQSTVSALTGDKAVLKTGATMPTDLVSAANTILTLTAERDALKAKETTTAAAVASLGVYAGTPGATAATPAATPANIDAATGIGQPAKVSSWNPDAAILAAYGVKTYADLEAKKIGPDVRPHKLD
ncbi:MAG TPA: hypothetical protein VGJ73_21245 [Verrucomicrobiae bacterium]|jgi:hypothetical protein